MGKEELSKEEIIEFLKKDDKIASAISCGSLSLAISNILIRRGITTEDELLTLTKKYEEKLYESKANNLSESEKQAILANKKFKDLFDKNLGSIFGGR